MRVGFMDARGFLFQNPLPLIGQYAKSTHRDLFRQLPRKARPSPTRMISVIIPAHNEEAYLRRTLVALRRQNYGWFEIVVVANGCTDRTAEIARGICQRVIVLSQKSLGVARNLGARMARGELLLFLDADTTLEPMALRRIAQDFSIRDAAGTLQGRPDSDRLACRLIYALKNFVHRWSLHPGSSGVILCWKEHFLRVGGFDEGLEVRENSDLIKRLRRFGRYRYIGDVSATTSMRRYEQRGVGRVVWLWCKLWLLSLVGDLHQRCYETVR
jgi:glycosyltransferase involved in cell wall biosynthesis